MKPVNAPGSGVSRSHVATAGPSPRPPGAWWRERWVGIASLALVLELLGFWAVSKDPVPIRRTTPTRQDSFVTDPAGSGPAAGAVSVLDAWSWLMTPAVFLLPSAEDFSGLAWIRGDPGGLEAEVFELPFRPLPWESVRVIDPPGSYFTRLDPGPAAGWEGPPGAVPIPVPGPVPMSVASRVRVVSGLVGRRIRSGDRPGLAQDGRIAAARPVVVRVTVDRSGELADPPVLWEPSDVGVADEAALVLARGLVFEPGPAAAELESGLVMVEWAGPRGTGPEEPEGRGGK